MRGRTIRRWIKLNYLNGSAIAVTAIAVTVWDWQSLRQYAIFTIGLQTISSVTASIVLLLHLTVSSLIFFLLYRVEIFSFFIPIGPLSRFFIYICNAKQTFPLIMHECVSLWNTGNCKSK